MTEPSPPIADDTAEEGYDPFEEFNRAQGAGQVENPYPMFAELRAQGPVAPLDLRAMLGLGGEGDGAELPTVFTAVTHEAVAEVLRDGKRFSSSGYAQTMGPVMGHSILEMDAPEHGRHRGLIQQAFSKKSLDRWEHELVRPVVDECIDAFAARGSAELVRELTFPFPVAVIAGMIGLPTEHYANFHRWAVELISVQVDLQRGLAASAKLRELFAWLLAERRREPRDDLISVLAHAELDGQRLDEEAIYAFLRLLAPAGAETTYRSSSNLLLGLLTHPDQLDALRARPELMEAAIDEGLRWECPLTGIMRTASEDSEVCGVMIPAGAIVYVNLAAANHDETRYERPDAFDILRPRKQHMAFAFGPHRCLGQHLAIMETRVVLEQLFARLPNLRLDPEAKDVHITGLTFRSPLALPVVFDPS